MKTAGLSDGGSPRSPKKTSKTPVPGDETGRLGAKQAESLSPKQLVVLRLLGRGLTRGIAPTNREIGAALRTRSTNGVAEHLDALERKGFIARGPSKARAIRLTRRGAEVLGSDPRGRCLVCGHAIGDGPDAPAEIAAQPALLPGTAQFFSGAEVSP